MPALLAASGVFARARLADEAVADTLPPPGRFVLAVRSDEVVLAGDVADESERRSLVDAVTSEAASRRVTDLLVPGGDRLPVPVGTATDLVAAARDAGTTDFTAVLDATTRTARATVADETRAAVLRQALDRADVRDHVVGTAESDLDVVALQRSITAMVRDDGGLRFEPVSATWEGQGPALVDRVGRLLSAAPRATVTLTGHATPEHPDPRGLAHQRAGLVRDLLVAQGVRPERIRTTATIDTGPESSDQAARRVDVLIS
ncbi:OmpA family protein [Actinosynnema sp. NPDC023587]|uniref:OmpA family protein n=1 Tax=Actinosynnema sp. NPDC023587 TaxID=3154695 RepID=UPI003409D660